IDSLIVIFIIVRMYIFFVSSRRRHTTSKRDWSSDVCSSDLEGYPSCDGEPCANVSDDSQDGTDTMADAAEGGDKAGAGSDLTARSEERRVGKECISPSSPWIWSRGEEWQSVRCRTQSVGNRD